MRSKIQREGKELVKSTYGIFVIVCLFTQTIVAAVGEWKSFTSMNNIRGIASYNNFLWAATEGGVFCYNTLDSTIEKITNAEGLPNNNVTAITVTQTGDVWIGHSTGEIDIYTPSSKKWKYISDISLSSFSQKTINKINIYGDSVFIAAGFGLVLYSISKSEFKETYSNFPSISQPNIVSFIISQQRIFAITLQNIFVSKQNAINLLAPDSWERYNISAPNSIVEWNNSVYVGTLQGIFKFENNAWNLIPNITNSTKILFNDNGFLYYINSNIVYKLDINGITTPISTLPLSNITCGIQNSLFYVGTEEQGLFALQNNEWKMITLNTPAANTFISLAVDENGTLWAGSARAYGKGFYSYDGTQWKNYNIAAFPQMPSNDCFKVSLGAKNSKWISTWGGGVIYVNAQNEIEHVFDSNNPGFIGVSENLAFVVPGKIALDNEGNTWLTVFRAANYSRVLWKMQSDFTWQFFPVTDNYHFMFDVVIDRNNTKWFTNTLPGFPTLSKAVFFNEAQNISGTTNGWGMLTESDGMPSQAITSIIIDKNGEVWLGTASGITIITDPSSPKNTLSAVIRGEVKDQFINCLAVDALNNKWVGTQQGIFVLSPDGTTILQHYTVQNTNGKLVSNNIFAIDFDTKKGFVYFGTEEGLSRLEIPTITPVEKFTELSLSPNPFIIPENSLLEIRNLVEETTIKILSVDGKLIHQFSAQGGGRALWDGKDMNGTLVSSGIYFIVATQNGKQTITSKVAVVRK